MRALFIQAPSVLLNPKLDEQTVAAAIDEDPEAGRAEWLGIFRGDLEAYLPDHVIDGCVTPGVRARPRLPGQACVAFVDMSGGQRDAAVLAIAHQDRGRAVLDRLDIVPAPHDPHKVAERFAQGLNACGLTIVCGDRYAGEWVPGAFSKYGIAYQHSELSASELYLEALPLFSAGLVELLDVPVLLTQLRLLERRPRASGRPDSVTHPRGGNDDAANACVGALWLASRAPANDDVPAATTGGMDLVYGRDANPHRGPRPDDDQRRDAALASMPIDRPRKILGPYGS
jgi:hypothetical protein